MKLEGKIKGDKLPPTPPSVLPFAQLYWEAFIYLSARRRYTDNGFPQYIVPSEILAYTELADIFNLSARRLLLVIVSSLEEVYMPFQTNRVKTQIEAERRKQEMRNRRNNKH